MRGQSGDRGTLGRGTGRTVNDGRLDIFWWLSAGDVFVDKNRLWGCPPRRESNRQKNVADALEIRSVLAECDMMVKMQSKTDGTTGGRETWNWPRASLGCAIVVAAALCAVSVVHWCPGLENTTRPTWSQRKSIRLFFYTLLPMS